MISSYILAIKKDIFVKEPKIKTKLIEIYSKYVFINGTQLPFNIIQANYPVNSIVCAANSKINYCWACIDQNAIAVNIVSPNCAPTIDFSINEIGPIVHQLISSDNKTLKGIILIERYMNKGVHYIKILDQPIDRPYYIIENCSQYFTVAYRELKSQLPFRYLPCNSKIPFGWQFPNQTHEIILNFFVGTTELLKISNQDYKFSMEDLIDSTEIILPFALTSGKSVYVALESDGSSKILRIRDTTNKILKATKQTQDKKRIIKINNIGVSIIYLFKGKKAELCYINLNSLELIISDINQDRLIRFSILQLQIDNQMQNDTIFPVILHASPKERTGAFLEIKCKIDLCQEKKTRFFVIESLEIQFDPIIVKLEEEQLIALQNFISFCSQNKIVEKENTENTESAILLKTCKISPIKFNILFKARTGFQKGETALISSLKTVFNGINELPIFFHNETFLNMFGHLKMLGLAVLGQYQEQLIDNKVGIIAGVLFAPFKDAKDIGVGITDFFKMEGNTSIAQGATSLVKGTFTGTFGTLSTVSSLVSKGVLSLSYDADFIKQKEVSSENAKSSGVIKGFGLGMYSVAKSIGSGLAGIVTKPIEGANKEGFIGFVKVNFSSLNFNRELGKV